MHLALSGGFHFTSAPAGAEAQHGTSQTYEHQRAGSTSLASPHRRAAAAKRTALPGRNAARHQLTRLWPVGFDSRLGKPCPAAGSPIRHLALHIPPAWPGSRPLDLSSPFHGNSSINLRQVFYGGSLMPRLIRYREAKSSPVKGMAHRPQALEVGPWSNRRVPVQIEF